jgi:leader peptidase (prepilin peptidase)/N-methyltransferase
VIEQLLGLARPFLEMLHDRDPAGLAVVGIFGLAIGSFLSVVIVRLPQMLEAEGGEEADAVTLVAPRSRCVQCGHRLRWYENIPVVSYVFLRARCAACHRPISPLYPIVESLSCIAAVVAALRFGGDPRLAGALVLSFALIAVSFIDFRHAVIPDDIVLPLLWLGLLCNAFDMFVPLRDALFGTVAAYLTLWAVYWIHRRTTGREGMGYGDFKLSAMMGAWLGIQSVPVFLVLAFAGGALFGAGLMIAGRARIASAIPFGPWLAVAGWVSLYWGDRLVDAYWAVIVPG